MFNARLKDSAEGGGRGIDAILVCKVLEIVLR